MKIFLGVIVMNATYMAANTSRGYIQRRIYNVCESF
jgi:hypothetical protein